MTSAPKKSRAQSVAEDRFWLSWRLQCAHLSPPTRQLKFHPERGWKFDFAWPEHKLAVEIDGRGKRGAHGRHHTVTGAAEDCEKGNEAVRLGWRVLHFPATHAAADSVAWVEYVCEVMFYGPSK